MNKLPRHLILGIADIAVVIVSMWLALVIRFDASVPAQYAQGLWAGAGLFVAVRIAVFYITGLYRSLWRYAGVRRVLTVAWSAAVGSLILFGIDALLGYPDFPRSIYPIEFLMTMFGVGGVRVLARIIRMSASKKVYPQTKRALIVGAGDAGVLLLREFESQPWLGVCVVGFVDDDPSKVGRKIDDVPVLGPREAIPGLVSKHAVNQVIIAMPSVGQAVIHETINLCKDAKVQVQILPAITQVIQGRIRAGDVRDVQIEDLLRREPIKTDLEAISGFLLGRRVLVTGAGGSIGSELCRQVASYGPDTLYILGHGENSIFDIQNELRDTFPDLHIVPLIADVQDESDIRGIFERHKPEVVFHAAAHKHVPLMEANPAAAVRNNVFGTRNVAQAAAAVGSESFVMISTDKAVNPGNIMGATKRLAEMVVQSMNGTSKTRFVSVRFGNVLGSRGSVVPLFKKQIAKGGPVTVTHPEMRRYFMTIPEAVQLVLQAGSLGKGGEVFLLDMGEPVKILDLATDLIRLSGLEPDKDIKVVFSGVRPGEKLFEELVNHGEHVKPTGHEKITCLNGQLPDPHNVEQILSRISEFLQAADVKGLCACLYDAVGTKPVEIPAVVPLKKEAAAAGENN